MKALGNENWEIYGHHNYDLILEALSQAECLKTFPLGSTIEMQVSLKFPELYRYFLEIRNQEFLCNSSADIVMAYKELCAVQTFLVVATGPDNGNFFQYITPYSRG